MHNAAFAMLGLDWRYLAFDVDPAHLADVIRGAQRMHFLGLNLTVPHKLLAMGIVDALDTSASTWGAVNTIVFEGREADGEWRPLSDFTDIPENIRSHGYNTDADAITRSIREDLGLQIAGTRVLLLGAGGAGRSAALKLASEGVAQLYLVNRTMSKAGDLAAEIKARHPHVEVVLGYPPGRIDLLLNATSLGLLPEDALPLDETQFPLSRAGAVYDMIYRPASTPLLTAARDAGCAAANGLGMLLYQGARALELWSGRNAPLDVMREALIKNIYTA